METVWEAVKSTIEEGEDVSDSDLEDVVGSSLEREFSQQVVDETNKEIPKCGFVFTPLDVEKPDLKLYRKEFESAFNESVITIGLLYRKVAGLN